MSPQRPVAEVIADIIRDNILNGGFLPGARLVEAELSKLYGVSRGPVREALRVLDAEGLIEIEKHRSPRVKGIDTSAFKQIFDLRAVLESFATRLATDKLHDCPEDVQWAKDELAAWENHTYIDDPELHNRQNKLMHARLLKIAGHALLSAQVNSLTMPGYRALLEPLQSAKRRKLAADEHATVLEMILRGDAEAAERSMREHIEQAGTTVLASFSHEIFSPQITELKLLTKKL